METKLEKTAREILEIAGIKVIDNLDNCVNIKSKFSICPIRKQSNLINRIVHNGNNLWDIQVHDTRFYKRVLTQGSLGLGESYMDGWWDCKRLDEFFYRVLKNKIDEKAREHLNLSTKLRFGAVWLGNLLGNRQTISKSKEVGKKHYDTGNYLFQKMLDKRMQYSCGYWKNTQNLEEAQESKLDLICKKINLKPGMKVLDIGCGFGGFAKYAAEKYKVKLIGVTISEEQAKLAKEICKGLDVEIRVQDYRKINEKFDRIVSVGMFEHVGSKNYKEFFKVANKLLKEDGLFLLHTIGKNTSGYSLDPFIAKYIFPGGELPSLAQITKTVEGLFVVRDVHNFAGDYDRTLMAWNKNFQENWNRIRELEGGKYDDRFKRMWEYYLQSCAGAFRAGNIQLWQIVLSKPGFNVNYQSVR